MLPVEVKLVLKGTYILSTKDRIPCYVKTVSGRWGYCPVDCLNVMF